MADESMPYNPVNEVSLLMGKVVLEPSVLMRSSCVFLDVCHMLKLMRNTLGSYGFLRDDVGELLHKLQEDEGLRLGNKLRNAHIQWQKQKMKVNIAAQTLSVSVADALEFLEDQGRPQFKGCGATSFKKSIMVLSFLPDSNHAFHESS
ncbi:uncharacterized protein [Diadema antillarum]|uniref:uncharacterized protein n=1 Tax=Diadema antillarum TaxID=105358 RepID=UPI003A88AC20